MSRKSDLDVAIAKNLAEIDKLRTETAARIRELEVVNDALAALKDAKKKFRKPRPLSVAELKGA